MAKNISEKILRELYWRTWNVADDASALRYKKTFKVLASVHIVLSDFFSKWYVKRGELFDARIINKRTKLIKKALREDNWYVYDDASCKTISEFEAHDLCATWYHFELLQEHQFDPEGGIDATSQIIIKWKGDNEGWMPSPKDRVRLEREINKCIQHMHKVDRILHDIAEYTC